MVEGGLGSCCDSLVVFSILIIGLLLLLPGRSANVYLINLERLILRLYLVLLLGFLGLPWSPRSGVEPIAFIASACFAVIYRNRLRCVLVDPLGTSLLFFPGRFLNSLAAHSRRWDHMLFILSLSRWLILFQSRCLLLFP